MSPVEAAFPFAAFVFPRSLSFQVAGTDPIQAGALAASMFHTLSWEACIEPSALFLHISGMDTQALLHNVHVGPVPVVPISFLPWSEFFFGAVKGLKAPAIALSIEVSAGERSDVLFEDTSTECVLQTASHRYANVMRYTGEVPKKMRFPSLRKVRVQEEKPSVLTVCAILLHHTAFGEDSVPIQVETRSIALRGDSPYCVRQGLAPYIEKGVPLYMEASTATFLQMLTKATPANFVALPKLVGTICAVVHTFFGSP